MSNRTDICETCRYSEEPPFDREIDEELKSSPFYSGVECRHGPLPYWKKRQDWCHQWARKLTQEVIKEVLKEDGKQISEVQFRRRVLKYIDALETEHNKWYTQAELEKNNPSCNEIKQAQYKGMATGLGIATKSFAEILEDDNSK